MEIYNNDNIIIYFYNNYKYGIKNNNNNPDNTLFKSIFHCGSLENIKRNDTYSSIFFQAESVISFDEFMDHCEKKYGIRKLHYVDCLNIIYSFKTQIMYLERNNKTFYNISLDKIVVIDFQHFLYLGNTVSFKEDKNNKQIHFLRPFKKNGFLSPEISSLQVLPAIIDYRSVYFSLASFIYFSLFGEICKDYSKLDNDENLETISYTKLYWFLLRNLNFDTKKRNIYYI